MWQSKWDGSRTKSSRSAQPQVAKIKGFQIKQKMCSVTGQMKAAAGKHRKRLVADVSCMFVCLFSSATCSCPEGSGCTADISSTIDFFFFFPFCLFYFRPKYFFHLPRSEAPALLSYLSKRRLCLLARLSWKKTHLPFNPPLCHFQGKKKKETEEMWLTESFETAT